MNGSNRKLRAWQEKLYRTAGWSEQKQATSRHYGLLFFSWGRWFVRFFYGFCLFFFVASSLIFLWYGVVGMALLYLVYALIYWLIGYLMHCFCVGIIATLSYAEMTHKIRSESSFSKR